MNSGREAGIRSGSEEQAREKGREKREVKSGWSERRSAYWFTIPWIHADYLTVLTEWDRGICKGGRDGDMEEQMKGGETGLGERNGGEIVKEKETEKDTEGGRDVEMLEIGRDRGDI